MIAPNPDVDTYVEQAPENRREGLRLLRDLCREHLHGFTEIVRYRMPGYVREEGAEGEIGFAAQKQYLSFYVTRTDVMAAHRDRLIGLDVGKGCIRYRRTDQIDVAVVRSILEMTAATRGPVC
ncbi:iron chaperone [Geodermatophilus sp. URMC 64]